MQTIFYSSLTFFFLFSYATAVIHLTFEIQEIDSHGNPTAKSQVETISLPDNDIVKIRGQRDTTAYAVLLDRYIAILNKRAESLSLGKNPSFQILGAIDSAGNNIVFGGMARYVTIPYATVEDVESLVPTADQHENRKARVIEKDGEIWGQLLYPMDMKNAGKATSNAFHGPNTADAAAFEAYHADGRVWVYFSTKKPFEDELPMNINTLLGVHILK